MDGVQIRETDCVIQKEQVLPKGYTEMDKDELSLLFKYEEAPYTNLDKLSFAEELRIHQDQTVFAFEYGEEVSRRTRERIVSTENKYKERRKPVEETPECKDDNQHDYESTASCSSPIPDQKTPHSHKHTAIHRKSKKRANTLDITPPKTRQTPLPLLRWADSTEVWQNMIYKEEASLEYRNAKLFDKRASFLPRMRAILLDWIMEVCEVYRLRRVTYYLAVDYIDRYLTIRPDVPKTQLQLVGVSCLFMASKLEEVYPPKLNEFSYVCDGACTNGEILACELLILNSLGWDVNPITPSGWLNLYMQIYFDAQNVVRQKLHHEINRNFLFPQYSGYQFIRASQIIDLFSLDPGFLRFSYSVIAAAAMYFIFGKKVALNVSGLTWDQLKECVEYMAVFYKVIRDTPDPKLRSIASHDTDQQRAGGPNNGALKTSVSNLAANENHSMQTHCVDLDYFEKATLLRLEQMGLKVEKTYVKKKKKKVASNIITDEENKKDEQPAEENAKETAANEEETTVVMFDVEKVNMEASIIPEVCIEKDKKAEDEPGKSTDINISVGSSVNIFSIESKTRVSFDDILASINEYNNNKNATQRSTSSSEDDDS